MRLPFMQEWAFANILEMDREECWEIYWYAWIAADIR